MSHVHDSGPAARNRPAVPRIVVALTVRERGLFFREADALHFDGCHRLDDGDLTPGRWERCLEELQPSVLITGWSTPPVPERWLGRADCPLRFVCHVTGSVRRLVPRSFLERGGVVTNWGETVSAQVAEHGLLLALAALRGAAQWPAVIKSGGERLDDLVTRTLFGRSVGLHGFGSVARALVPLLRPFGVNLAAYSAGVPGGLMQAAGVTPCATLAELFDGSEVVFECEALTPSTSHSVSAEVLARLRDDAVFVNIGRGGVVDEAALAREAITGRLRLALDVTASEPITSASPFFGRSNVVLSPHIGGPTRDRYHQCGDFALVNLRRFLDGGTPPAAISLVAYDRAT